MALGFPSFAFFMTFTPHLNYPRQECKETPEATQLVSSEAIIISEDRPFLDSEKKRSFCSYQTKIIWKKRVFIALSCLFFGFVIFGITYGLIYRIVVDRWLTGPSVVSGLHASAATEHPACSKIATNILKMNGNAVDGAIAAAICIGTYDVLL